MKAIYRKRLLKLAAFLAGPVARAEKRSGNQKFDMRTYASHRGNIGLRKKECNTSACALGWASKLWPRTFNFNEEGWFLIDGRFLGDWSQPGEFFGLTNENARLAFSGSFVRTVKEEVAILRKLAAGK